MVAELVSVVLPFAVALVVSMLIGPGVIAMLKLWKIGQTIQEDGPESHRPKAGTPTVGGLIIIAGMLAGVIAGVWLTRTQLAGLNDGLSLLFDDIVAVMVLVLAYALLGMVDDYLTVHPVGGVRGISSKPKAFIQVVLATGFVLWLKNLGWEPVLSVAGHSILSGWLYWLFAVVFITGMANFVNITDGLDGLVSGLSAIAAVGLVSTVMRFPGDVVANQPILLSSIAGACVAFLWFNTNPAKVFMGDTGALALGAAFPAIAIIMHCEVLLIVISIVFVLDGLSTAVQWAYFKYTRIRTGTGKRVFLKSPIHHHFEMLGWPEQTVVVRFWICGVIAAVLGFAGAAMGWW